VSDKPPSDAYPRGRRLSLASGQPLTVGQFLASGGEGYVYSVDGDDAIVFKQIRPEALAKFPDRERRLTAMAARPPAQCREAGSGHVLLAWPLETVLDGARFVGFVMPRISGRQSAELHILANPSDRNDPGPDAPPWVRGFTWRYLLATATNLALATDALHSGKAVFGDFNERNILVSPQARVTFIDCDSMQVPDPRGGHFLCLVGRAEFNAPELRRIDLKVTAREPSSDLFPLAVHIHQLLLEGLHPFDGVWHAKADEKPKRPDLAGQGLYVHAGDRRLNPPPGAIDIDLVPGPVQDLFRRAFVDGARDPRRRPTGREWRDALTAIAANLKTCRQIEAHIYPDHHATCPWCAHDARRAAEPTSPAVRPLSMETGTSVFGRPTLVRAAGAPQISPYSGPPPISGRRRRARSRRSRSRRSVTARPGRTPLRSRSRHERRTRIQIAAVALLAAGGIAVSAIERAPSNHLTQPASHPGQVAAHPK
jgi:DNA-binding helix-hairpin-helix protein with protein kinase domain